MKLFIGHDSKMAIASDVLEYSIKKYTTKPLSIIRLKLSELDFNRPWDPLQATEFAFSRFLCPHLCGFSPEVAVFMDNDMLALSDITGLFEMDMDDYALRVVKHDHVPTTKTKLDGRVQTQYNRKNWSSLMVMRPDRLKCWTKEAVETQSGKWLHQFVPIDDSLIGDLPATYNVLDQIKADTKLVHYTEGLPAYPGYENHPHGGVWFKTRDEYTNGIL